MDATLVEICKGQGATYCVRAAALLLYAAAAWQHYRAAAWQHYLLHSCMVARPLSSTMTELPWDTAAQQQQLQQQQHRVMLLCGK